jgi:hypothetical protein
MIGPHDAYLVQVKANRKPGKKEMEAMELFQCPPFMHKVLHIWHDRVKEPEIIGIARARPEKEVVDILTHPHKAYTPPSRACGCGGWDEYGIPHGDNCKGWPFHKPELHKGMEAACPICPCTYCDGTKPCKKHPYVL